VRKTDQARGIAVWDLPTRAFHWLLVALIAFSWWSAEEGAIEWHMRSGYAILALLTFRILWGFFGSSTARFANFLRGPAAIAAYVRDMRGWSPVGHNPVGALSVLVMLALLAFQLGTGLIQIDTDDFVEGPLAHLVSFDVADRAHQLHDLGFDILLVVIGLHVAAILFYHVALGRNLTGPMISGRTQAAGTEAMRPGKTRTALLCLGAAAALALWVSLGAPPSAP